MCAWGYCWFNGLCSANTNSLGSITINFGDHRGYTIPWNAYFYDTELNTCEMLIYAEKQSGITIGNSFLNHFYTLYDVTYQTVSIALASYTYGSITPM